MQSHQTDAVKFVMHREEQIIPNTGPAYEQKLVAQDHLSKQTQDIDRMSLSAAKGSSYTWYRGKGGLLADEMGLGKTLSMLTAIASTIEEAQSHAFSLEDHPLTSTALPTRTTLVIVPSTRESRIASCIGLLLTSKELMEVWRSEIST